MLDHAAPTVCPSTQNLAEKKAAPCAARQRCKSDLNGPRRMDSDGMRLRATGLCFNHDCTQVLLVTSCRSPQLWVIPGGGLEQGETSEQAVVREVLEEAGVQATVLNHTALFTDLNRKTRTHLFTLRVKEEMPTWAEQSIGRERRWFSLESAMFALKPVQKQYLESVSAQQNLQHAQAHNGS